MDIKLRGILFFVLVIMALAGLFVVQVWKQNEYVRLTKQNRALCVQLEKVKSDIANIMIDTKWLKDYKRLEKLARDDYGLVYAGVPEFIESEER
ncbi:MAG: hypothetical protein HQK83_03775 [Fibrobacteria bacterium]|nr:hypothetical protein [Fibrobacteria bacterium]